VRLERWLHDGKAARPYTPGPEPEYP